MAKPDRLADEQAQLDRALGRFQGEIEGELRAVVAAFQGEGDAQTFYPQMAYHLGWVDRDGQPIPPVAGKQLRPGLLLWACDLAALATGADDAARAERHYQALPAAAAVELVHNFSLIHDDIEDQDHLRRGRPTLWSIWGEAQAINTGDGMFALARLALWQVVERGVAPALAVQLAALLDRTCLRLCEGQHRDMISEGSATITPAMYLDTIGRKTAALMRAATAMGGMLGAPEAPAISVALAEFGEALGTAFQLRDDLLGIWASSAELGKVAAGDVQRKKMTLPVIYALATAPQAEQAIVLGVYRSSSPPTPTQIATVLGILDRTAHEWCRQQLAAYCATARLALQQACGDAATSAPAQALAAMVDYIALAARG
jgi:geranylgeranyl diphosphate synthase type I